MRSRVDVEVASGDHLNVNVSRAMLDVAMGVLAKDAKDWWASQSSLRAGPGKQMDKNGVVCVEKETRDKEADADERAGDGDAFHPLWIKNETGQRILLEAHPQPTAARAAAVETHPPGSPATCPSLPTPMAAAGQPRHPGPGGTWQQVEAGGMHPVTCVPLVSTPATGAGPGLPQVSLRLLRVYLAHPEPASAPGAGNGPTDAADTAAGPAWDDPAATAPDPAPSSTRPPPSSRPRAAAGPGDGVLDTGRMLHGSIDLDLPGRQASPHTPPPTLLPGRRLASVFVFGLGCGYCVRAALLCAAGTAVCCWAAGAVCCRRCRPDRPEQMLLARPHRDPGYVRGSKRRQPPPGVAWSAS